MENTLDWTGLDWTGLDWTELDWTGLPCIRPCELIGSWLFLYLFVIPKLTKLQQLALPHALVPGQGLNPAGLPNGKSKLNSLSSTQSVQSEKNFFHRMYIFIVFFFLLPVNSIFLRTSLSLSNMNSNCMCLIFLEFSCYSVKNL